LGRYKRPEAYKTPAGYAPAVQPSTLKEIKELTPLRRPDTGLGRAAISLSEHVGRLSQAPIMEIVSGNVFQPTLWDKSGTMAAISPVLGQYAGKMAYPDDWCLYWEYLYAYLCVPEVTFAVNTKTRMMWDPGWHIEAQTEKLEEKLTNKLKGINFELDWRALTKLAYISGNGYGLLVTDAEYGWDESDPKNPHFQVTQEPTELRGLKLLDSRTMRRFVDPWNYDPIHHDIEVQRYLQRVYASPLGPVPRKIYLDPKHPKDPNLNWNEVSIYPPVMAHLRFNRIYGSIYGYAPGLRETLTTLKGYLVMNQYLPLIFQKRADPLLHFSYGGNVLGYNNQQMTIMPSGEGQLDYLRSQMEGKIPGGDLYTDQLTQVEEVYKSNTNMRGLPDLMAAWLERVWHGFNMPIKGTQFENEAFLSELHENQLLVEQLVNNQVIPLFTAKDATFHFNDLVPDDWYAKARVVTQLMQSGIINKLTALYMLGLPEDAGEGAVPISIYGMNPTFAGQPQLMAKPPRMKSAKAKAQPNYSNLSPPKEIKSMDERIEDEVDERLEEAGVHE
jgi:hypothetical protein